MSLAILFYHSNGIELLFDLTSKHRCQIGSYVNSLLSETTNSKVQYKKHELLCTLEENYVQYDMFSYTRTNKNHNNILFNVY